MLFISYHLIITSSASNGGFLTQVPRQRQLSRVKSGVISGPAFRLCCTKAFRKRIAGYLQLGNPVVLVGSDCDEAGFWKCERAEVAVSGLLAVSALVNQDHVEPWLVPVHGVQDHVAIIIQQVVGEFKAVE